jgi:hypothetical protein
MSGPPFSGGCQCGAVRYRITAAPGHASLCHCRMCQKATGGVFGAFASFPTAQITWTRGERKVFRSSDAINRGFCGDCGTPLTFEAASGEGRHLAITLGSFDDPSALPPDQQIMVAERIAWADRIPEVPRATAAEDAAGAAKYPPVVSRQHPDHDTDAWDTDAGPPTR